MSISFNNKTIESLYESFNVVVVVVEYLFVRLKKNCVSNDFLANGTFDDDVVDDEHDYDKHLAMMNYLLMVDR